MNKSIKLLLILALFSIELLSQNENPLGQLQFLVDSKWQASGEWGNNAEYNQTIISEWSLNKKIIKQKIQGIVNPETGQTGLRNEAIIAFDEDENKIKSWIFDIYGEIIETIIIIENENIYVEYPYKYGGETKTFRDVWIKIDNDTFEYRVELKEKERWKNLLLNGKVKRIN